MVEIFVIMEGLIFSASMSTAIAQSNYVIKVAKTTEGDFTVIRWS